MGNLTAFLRPNVEQVPNKKIVASTRIRDENGRPIEWEVRCISADEYAKIRSDCMTQVPVPGKRGQFTTRFDSYAFQAKVAARCTVFPNLEDAELQGSWGVVRPEDLLGKILIGGEFDDYATAVLELNGFTRDGDLVEEAKN